MKEIHKAPLLYALLPLMAGMLYVLKELPVSYAFIRIAAFFFFSAYLLFFLKPLKILKADSWTNGLLLSFFFFFAGCWIAASSNISSASDFYRPGEKSSFLIVTIETQPEVKNTSIKYIADIKGTFEKGSIEETSGKTLLYLAKDMKGSIPQFGDLLLINARLREIHSPRNPGEFDFRQYMRSQNVHYTAWLGKDDWEPTGVNEASSFWLIIHALKTQLTAIADEGISGKDERGVFKALLLGDKNELEPHIKASYSGTGTMHVLAVSGLHVGILFFILNLLISRFKQNVNAWVRILCILLILWAYAAITGFSPSVTRAVTMFSLVTVGSNIERLNNIYNTLAAAALGLLLYNPNWLLSVGFQLSFIAVLGIVWLQPKIYTLIAKPRWLLTDKAWQITSTTLAAQLVTFPLGLLYFQQFPNLFLISNLLVLPYIPVLMGTGIGFLILKPITLMLDWNILANWLDLVVTSAFQFLNFIVAYMEQLPYSASKGIHINVMECLLIYALISTLAFAFILRKRQVLWYGISIMLALAVYRTTALYTRHLNNMVTVHSVRKTTLISVKHNNKLFLIGDSSFLANEDAMQYSISPFAAKMGISKEQILTCQLDETIAGQALYYQPPYGQAGNRNFLIVSSREQFFSLPEYDTTMYDMVILANSPRIAIKDLSRKLKFKTLVFSPRNKGYVCKRWMQECEALNIPYYNLYDRNAYQVKI